MPPKSNAAHLQPQGTTKSEDVSASSIRQRPVESKSKKKGVEFDPTLEPHDYEDSERRGHSKQEDHKEQEEIDLTGDHGKHIFCKNLQSSMYPLVILLRLFGRFPPSRKRSKDRKTYEYTAGCASFGLFHFNITTIVLFYALITGSITIAKVTLDVPLFQESLKKGSKAERIYTTQLKYERALVQRNTIPLIIVFTTLVQACISSVFFTRKREYLAHIFTFLSKTAFTLHMDLAEKAKDFSVQSTCIFTVVTCIFIMFSCLKFGPSSVGTPTVFGSLILRGFLSAGNKRIWLNPNAGTLLVVKVVGGIFLIVIFTASVAPILLFIYKCKIVRNAIAFWNGRAYCALLRGMEHAQTEEARTTYNFLFKDHCVLLDLVESIDQMYSFTIESFFGLQAISFFFQMYFLYRTGTQSKLSTTNQPTRGRSANYMRPYDWLPALLILFATSAILLCAGRAAAKVAEEAEAGMEVIRRKGVIGRRTDQELEFLYSMSFSFQSYKKLEISGAGYLYYNKVFFIQFIAVSFFCFLLLCQFRPLMDYKPTSDKLVGRFLRRIEGTSEHKSPWTNASDNREWALGF